MILQYLVKVDAEEKNREVIRDSVTEVKESDDKVVVQFMEPSGETHQTTFKKPHHQIYNMWLLNDNFKTLKRLI